MNEKKKTGNIVATIIGIIVYVLVFIVIGRITRMVSSGEFSTEQIRLVNSFNGVFSQIQVLSIVVMVVMDRKRGFIVGILLQGVGLLNVLIVQLLIAHNVMSLPGAVTGIVSIIIYVIIYTSMERNRKLHDEVTAKYQELIENHEDEETVERFETADYDSPEVKLLIPEPYARDVYVAFLRSKIAQADAETDRYNLYAAVFNNEYSQWAAWYNRNVPLKKYPGWRY